MTIAATTITIIHSRGRMDGLTGVDLVGVPRNCLLVYLRHKGMDGSTGIILLVRSHISSSFSGKTFRAFHPKVIIAVKPIYDRKVP